MDEKALLADLSGKPLFARARGYFRLCGPGYMQSALTLGGGSIAACVTFGSLMGYELLWVQPVAIILGYFVLAAVAKQTTHTGQRPYGVFWRRLHPALAIAWGVSALVATLIWHFPQYSLSGNGVITLAQGVGLDLGGGWGRAAVGACLLGAACLVTHMYNSGARGVRHFEVATKILVWLIVVAFALVAIAAGIQWRRFFLGITGVTFARNWMDGGVPAEAVVPVVGGMAAALGINMVFLYPYSLLNKNWTREYKELAYFDLVSGMVVPFLFATTFMILAVANTIGPAEGEVGTAVRDIREIVPVLGGSFGRWFGSVAVGEAVALLLIGLGMVSIGFTSIITMMLACGFIGCEMFGVEHTRRARWWFSLMPVIGVLGVATPFPWQAAITASSLNAILLPLAVLCFLILLNMRSYMGDETPRGAMRVFWVLVMVTSITVMTIAGYFGLSRNWHMLRDRLGATATPAVEAPPPSPVSGDAPVQTETPVLDLAEAPADAAAAGEDGEHMFAVFTHEAMATSWGMTVHARPEDTGTAELRPIAEAAWDAVDDVEARFSRWRETSQTSYINTHAAEEPVRVAPDVFSLIAECKQTHEATDGAFDPTIGPLIELWGFYRGEGHLPTDREIAETLHVVGMDKVVLDADDRTVRFDRRGVRLDFGGVAKGLALDEAARVLRSFGVERAMLHSGTSTVVAIGAPPGQPGWTVRVKNPYNNVDSLDEVLISDESLSTSGSYEKFFELDGQKYCHIFDPATGRPVEGRLSATAIAPTGVESDALSTAFFVMGTEETREYCEQHPEVRAIVVNEPERGLPRPVRVNFAETEEAQ